MFSDDLFPEFTIRWSGLPVLGILAILMRTSFDTSNGYQVYLLFEVKHESLVG